jgi:hypothetical protein
LCYTDFTSSYYMGSCFSLCNHIVLVVV